MRLNQLRKTLAFAAVVELGTGLALVIAPAIVARLVLGTDLSGAGVVFARFFGIALLALALSCWPSRESDESRSPAWRAMLTYNGLFAVYLAYLGTAGHLGGSLLWPAAVFHAVVAFLLFWLRFKQE